MASMLFSCVSPKLRVSPKLPRNSPGDRSLVALRIITFVFVVSLVIVFVTRPLPIDGGAADCYDGGA